MQAPLIAPGAGPPPPPALARRRWEDTGGDRTEFWKHRDRNRQRWAERHTGTKERDRRDERRGDAAVRNLESPRAKRGEQIGDRGGRRKVEEGEEKEEDRGVMGVESCGKEEGAAVQARARGGGRLTEL